jgi:hypothetical protein
MSCPFLQKLAPETRNLIYEYVLTFDAPLKHVRQLRPFLEKFGQSTELETETASSEERSTVSTSDSSNRANTSILSTSKLIYTEAIVALYKSNVIIIDSRMLSNPDKDQQTATILASDLSLATQVEVKLKLSFGTANEVVVGLGGSRELLVTAFPQMFPKLDAASVCIYTDPSPNPVAALFVAAHAMRLSEWFDTVQFEGVGSVVAYRLDQPQMRLAVRCQAAIEHWENDGVPGLPGFLFVTAREMYRNSRGLPPGTVDATAQGLFNRGHNGVLPRDYPVFEAGTHEFWTVTNELVRQAQVFLR